MTRSIVAGLFTSLDGVVEADDDWQFAYFDEELPQRISAGFSRVDAVLLGRRSNEGYDALHPAQSTQTRRWLRFWTRRPSTSCRRPSTRSIGTTLVTSRTRSARWSSSPGRAFSSSRAQRLCAGLLRNGPLDELNIIVLPIVVGSGARLFQDLPIERIGLELTESKAHGSGGLELRYKRASQ